MANRSARVTVHQIIIRTRSESVHYLSRLLFSLWPFVYRVLNFEKFLTRVSPFYISAVSQSTIDTFRIYEYNCSGIKEALWLPCITIRHCIQHISTCFPVVITSLVSCNS